MLSLKNNSVTTSEDNLYSRFVNDECDACLFDNVLFDNRKCRAADSLQNNVLLQMQDYNAFNVWFFDQSMLDAYFAAANVSAGFQAACDQQSVLKECRRFDGNAYRWRDLHSKDKAYRRRTSLDDSLTECKTKHNSKNSDNLPLCDIVQTSEWKYCCGAICLDTVLRIDALMRVAAVNIACDTFGKTLQQQTK
jgi:hypothetical protein